MKIYQKLILFVLAVILSYQPSKANDSEYFTSGNQLVPLVETNISISKEILTITVSDDSYANVDVYYEFYNPDTTRTILMGFEADPPYGAVTFKPEKSLEHPFIKDFTVTMNGNTLPYKNAITSPMKDGRIHPIDMREWNFFEEGAVIVNKKDSDQYQNYSFAYYFNATFNHGTNIVHHTYRYEMSASVVNAYNVSYKLSPAMRWANHKIDDFTLRINVGSKAKNFIINGQTFLSDKARLLRGTGKVRSSTYKGYIEADTVSVNAVTTIPCTEVVLKKGSVAWHLTDFKPKEELQIYSSDYKYCFDDDYKSLDKKNIGRYYDSAYGPFYNPTDYKAKERRIIRNLPYANRGYVFKDKKLKAYFSKFWWYMPDKSWKPSTADFNEEELNMIKK